MYKKAYRIKAPVLLFKPDEGLIHVIQNQFPDWSVAMHLKRL